MNGVSTALKNDAYSNNYILNDDDSLVWKYDNGYLVSSSNTNNYLNASYTGAFGYYNYYLNVNGNKQSWIYTNGGLYTNYTYVLSKDLYVYLDVADNRFKCDNNSNNKGIEIYEKSDEIVVDYYQTTTSEGGS